MRLLLPLLFSLSPLPRAKTSPSPANMYTMWSKSIATMSLDPRCMCSSMRRLHSCHCHRLCLQSSSTGKAHVRRPRLCSTATRTTQNTPSRAASFLWAVSQRSFPGLAPCNVPSRSQFGMIASPNSFFSTNPFSDTRLCLRRHHRLWQPDLICRRQGPRRLPSHDGGRLKGRRT